MFTKYKKLVIALATILVLSLIVFLVVAGRKPAPEEEQRQTSPNPFGIETAGPPLDNYVAARLRLTPDKENLKQEIINPLGGGAGTLTETANFRVDYLPAPDIFQVEIKSTYIDSSKDEAVSWFKNKGFSEEDVCNLPVIFSLDFAVAQQYEGSGLVFYPIPDFCQ